MIRIELPYPPSVNHYWRQQRGMVYVSAEGMNYRKAVAVAVYNYIVAHSDVKLPIQGKVSVSAEIYCPDNRRRDMDNILKALFDSLTEQHVWLDDSQVKQFYKWNMYSRKEHKHYGGCVVVSIENMEDK